MKRSLICTLVLGLAIAFSATGCKHSKKGITPITGQKAMIDTPKTGPGNAPGGLPPGLPQANPNGVKDGNLQDPNGSDLKNPDGSIKNQDLGKFADRPVDYAPFKAYTVYFDYDRATVRESEKSKLEAVVEFMKKESMDKDLLIEGHCDERGTEEYNRALGERRAQAVREYLVNLGLSAARIQTMSYGKDMPLDPEHNEAAWSKNRRGQFGLLLPKAGGQATPATPQ